MNKIEYLRGRAAQQYNNRELEAAADTGELLLREHWHNRNFWTAGYASDLFNLARVYEKMDNLERAAELYSDSARQTAAAEGESMLFAARLSCLALVLGRMGITEPAFFMHGHVTTIHRRELGNRDPLYADSLYNLANAAADAGRRKDSLRYHLDALRIRELVGKPADVINSLHSIAFLYEGAREYEKAASYAETALKLARGDEIASACNYLAGLYESCEKFEDALPLYDRVLEAARSRVGRRHSAYLNTAYRRANLLALMNRPREALESHEEVRGIFENISGTQHLFYANCLRSMAVLHMDLGDTGRAEALMLESIKIRRASLDDVTADIVFLIRLYLRERQTRKALEALIYALMCSDSKEPEFAALICALAEVFSRPGDNRKSEFIQALEELNDREKLRPIIDRWTAWEAQA